MTKVVAQNYTDAQVAIIRAFPGTGANGALNLADATAIASDPAMNDSDGNARKPRSIVAKINRLELPYEKKAPTRKDGSAVASKAKLVEAIAAATGITFDSLDKAARADLVALRDHFAKAA